MEIKADLHIHSCLSPCGDLEMGPASIVDMAIEKGLDLIALTDHNSCLNTVAVDKLCKEKGLGFIPGIEVSTVEELHVVCLFENIEIALEFSDFISSKQVKIKNRPEKMGDQLVVDEEENIVDEVEHYLLAATSLSMSELCKEVHNRGGLFIPAHIDRAAFSVSSQIGYLPDLDYDAVECVNKKSPYEIGDLKILNSSDAHYLDDIGKRFTRLSIEKPYFLSLKKILNNT